MTITVHESWKGLIVEPGQWFIARWPDGTWCDWDERHTMTHMSDDYERREVTYMNEEGEPEGTIPCF